MWMWYYETRILVPLSFIVVCGSTMGESIGVQAANNHTEYFMWFSEVLKDEQLFRPVNVLLQRSHCCFSSSSFKVNSQNYFLKKIITPSVRLSICLSVRLSIRLSLCLSVCPRIYLSVCPPIRPSYVHPFIRLPFHPVNQQTTATGRQTASWCWNFVHLPAYRDHRQRSLWSLMFSCNSMLHRN